MTSQHHDPPDDARPADAEEGYVSMSGWTFIRLLRRANGVG